MIAVYKCLTEKTWYESSIYTYTKECSRMFQSSDTCNDHVLRCAHAQISESAYFHIIISNYCYVSFDRVKQVGRGLSSSWKSMVR